MKTISLSDLQYESLINANNQDSWWNQRDIILNSISNSENDSKQPIGVSIRCLSIQEYNKYLINGTCNGSIVSNDDNVWHPANYDRALFCYEYSYDFTPRKGEQVNLWWYGDGSGYGTAVLQCDNVTIVPVGDKQAYGATFYYYYAIVQDSSGSTCSIANKKFLLECYGKNKYHARAINDYNVRELELAYSGISKSAITHTLPNLTGHHYSGYGLRDIWVTPVVYTGFRPVFQYKDSNKSHNIYC